MTWFKVDDQAAFGPKHVQAGNEAVGAWVRAGAWSAAQLTDGFIPTTVAHSIAPKKVWSRLADAKGCSQHGLVEVRNDGYQLHDYLAYNEPAAKVKAKREAWASRQGKTRVAIHKDINNLSKMSRSDTTRDSQIDTHVDSTRDSTSPDPDPDPDPDQPVTKERGSETSMPPAPASARGLDTPELTPEWLAGCLSHEVFAPLRRDRWLDDLACRLSTTGVLAADVEPAAEDFARKRSGEALGASELVRALVGYVGAEKRRRVTLAAKDGPLQDHERRGMDIWSELWAREHGGETYPPGPKDNGHIRAITARARTRARSLGDGVKIGDVLRYYMLGYLRLDDRNLVKRRYPLAMLESQMAAIGEYELPRTKREAEAPSEPTGIPMPAGTLDLIGIGGLTGHGVAIARRSHP